MSYCKRPFVSGRLCLHADRSLRRTKAGLYLVCTTLAQSLIYTRLQITSYGCAYLAFACFIFSDLGRSGTFTGLQRHLIPLII